MTLLHILLYDASIDNERDQYLLFFGFLRLLFSPVKRSCFTLFHSKNSNSSLVQKGRCVAEGQHARLLTFGLTAHWVRLPPDYQSGHMLEFLTEYVLVTFVMVMPGASPWQCLWCKLRSLLFHCLNNSSVVWPTRLFTVEQQAICTAHLDTFCS